MLLWVSRVLCTPLNSPQVFPWVLGIFFVGSLPNESHVMTKTVVILPQMSPYRCIALMHQLHMHCCDHDIHYPDPRYNEIIYISTANKWSTGKDPVLANTLVFENALYYPIPCILSLCFNPPAQKYLCISSISLIYKYKRPSIYTQLKQKKYSGFIST